MATGTGGQQGEAAVEALIPGGVHAVEPNGQVVGTRMPVPVRKPPVDPTLPLLAEAASLDPFHYGTNCILQQRQHSAHDIVVGDHHLRKESTPLPPDTRKDSVTSRIQTKGATRSPVSPAVGSVRWISVSSNTTRGGDLS